MHYGHKNIIDYCDRPFRDVAEMDQALIENYCSVVRDTDTVYFLGDHVMGDRQNGLNLIKSLPGTKIALRGNHDYDHSIHKQKIRDKWIPIYKDTFQAVIESWDILQTWSDRTIKMCHFPTTFQFDGDRKYEAYRPDLDGCDWLLCGHVHDAFRTDAQNKTTNVGVDVWNFFPVSQDQLIEEINQFQ
jgi:calcineurin-like phosphoesterase family protein